MPESLLARLKRTARLPTPPGTALEILRLCQRDDISINRLADTLAADPALSLRLLKYANSAMFGVRKEVTNVRDAVLLLGVRSVRLMSLSFSLLATDDDRACRGFDFTSFWSHSLAAAVAARYLAQRDHRVSPEEAFAAGLLSQIGKLVFAVGMPEEYSEVLDASGGTLSDTSVHEQTRFQITHHALGADLIEEWGIPQRMAAAIRFQRATQELASEPDLQGFSRLISTAVDIADQICRLGTAERQAERSDLIAQSGVLDPSQSQDEAFGAILAEFTDLATTLNLRSDFTPSINEIQAEAGEVLGDLSLATQLKSDAVEKENQGLQEKAFTDALTGVSNRAAFERQLAQAWEDASRHGRPLGLILLDIDHFKKFNDVHGHRTGDAVLRTVGSIIPRAVRQVDFVARYGGEEFAVILPRVDRLIAAQICVKIRRMIELHEVRFESKVHKVTVSVGAAVLTRVCRGFLPPHLIEAADKQLYVAKGKGRNCCSMRQLEPAAGGARMAAAR